METLPPSIFSNKSVKHAQTHKAACHENVFWQQCASHYSTEEGHCCQRTFSLQTALCVCLADLLEKREGACALFVL